MIDQSTDRQINSPTDRPTDGRTDGLMGKYDFKCKKDLYYLKTKDTLGANLLHLLRIFLYSETSKF